MINLHDQFGNISLAAIDPAEVAKLDDDQQRILAALVSAVQAREAAQERYAKAVIAARDAEVEQAAALTSHIAANPAPSFQDVQAAAVAAFNKSN